MNSGDGQRSSFSAPTRGGRSLIPVADVTNAFGSVFIAVAIALTAAYAAVPDVRPWIGARNGLVAWMTTAALAMAIVAGVWAYRRSTHESNFRLMLPIAASVLLAQSLRFGADLFGFPLPTLSGVEVGSLIDLRDVVSINAERLGLGFPTGILVLSLIVTGTVVAAMWARRWADDRVLVTEAPVVMWFVASVGSAVAVPVMGMFGEGTGAWFATEMVGLASAGFLVIASLAAGDHRRTVAGWRRRIWPWIVDEGPLAGIPSDTV